MNECGKIAVQNMAALDLIDSKLPNGSVPPIDPLPTNAPPSSNPFSLKRYPPGVRKIASFGLTLFVIGLFVAGSWAPKYWEVSVLCSGACMALGWLTGFLFGVPRVASTAASARVNTNLEQISDWLTKILVGVGLTQIGQLPGVLTGLAGNISKNFGDRGNDVFSLSMVLYFYTLGFLTGYLLTRLVLQQAFDEEAAEQIEVSTKGPAEVKVTQPAPDKSAADKQAAEAADKAAADKEAAEAADKAAADKEAAEAADKAAADKEAAKAADKAAADKEAADAAGNGAEKQT